MSVRPSGSLAGFVFRLYGIDVLFSRDPTPFVPGRPTLHSPPSVTVEWSTEALSGSRGSGPFSYEYTGDGVDILEWRGLYQATISADGTRISVHPLSKDNENYFWSYLLNQILSFSLIKLGFEPIHATCLRFGDRAAAFIAPSGVGKSTLAAALLGKGHKLVTDDLLVLVDSTSGLMVQPAMPRIKLYPAVARRLAPQLAGGMSIAPGTKKLVFMLHDDSFYSDPLRLGALYVLRPGSSSRVSIRFLSAKSGLRELVESSFNKAVLHDERLHQQMKSLVSCAERVVVKSITYPRTFGALPDLATRIEQDVAGSTD